MIHPHRTDSGSERADMKKPGSKRARRSAKAGLVTLAARVRISPLNLTQATAEVIKTASKPSFFGRDPSLAKCIV